MPGSDRLMAKGVMTALMRAAHQQHWEIDFAIINRIRIPVGLASMLLLMVIVGRSIRRRRLDDLGLLAATSLSHLWEMLFSAGDLRAT